MAYQNKKKQKKTFLLSNSILGYLFPVLSSNVVYDSIHYLVVISFVSLLLSFSPCCQLYCQLYCCQVLSKFPCLSFRLWKGPICQIFSCALTSPKSILPKCGKGEQCPPCPPPQKKVELYLRERLQSLHCARNLNLPFKYCDLRLFRPLITFSKMQVGAGVPRFLPLSFPCYRIPAPHH
jgi:hypothetical protein